MTTSDPVAVVRRYIDAFNRGEPAAMASAFADQAFILDGMPPHVWSGPTATLDWRQDVLAEAERHGASDYAVIVGEPMHDAVTGDSAYVVLPASMSFKVHGQQVTQSGATFTVALRRLSGGWRITAWAWTKGKRE